MFNGVGGSMVSWAGMWHPLQVSDFEVRTRDGVADDWPIGYEDLQPFYERAAARMICARSVRPSPLTYYRTGRFNSGRSATVSCPRQRASCVLLVTGSATGMLGGLVEITRPVTEPLPLTVVPVEDRLAVEARQNVEVFALLYERHVDRVFRYLRARGAHESDAAELTSLTFERALRHIDRYRPGGPGFAAWLLRIARNAWIDAGRRRRDRVQRKNEPMTSVPLSHSQSSCVQS